MRSVLVVVTVVLTGCGAAQGPPEAPGLSADAARAGTRAEALVQAGRLAEAAELYDRAASLDPSSARIWLGGARVRFRLQQWPEAITRAERALALDGDDPQTVTTLGHAYLAARRLDPAHRLYRQLVLRRPTDARGWAGLASVAAARRDLEAAARNLERAVASEPGAAEYWARLGTVRRRLRRPAAAARALDRAARLDPGRRALDRQVYELALEGGDPDVARSAASRLFGAEAAEWKVATGLLGRDDPVGAAGALEQLLERDASRHDARLLLARIHARVGRLDASALLLEALPESAPQWVDGQRLSGRIRAASGDLPGALRHLRAAFDVSPERKDVTVELAEACRATGALEEARARLAVAIERWPDDASVRYQHAMVVYAMGDEDVAVRAMFGVLSVQEDHPGALNFIGYTWTLQGRRLARAEAFIRRALDRRPDDGGIVDSLGWVLFKRGQLEEAEAELRRAVTLSPDSGEIHFHLAEVLWARGRRGEARAHYEAAVSKTREGAERQRFEARRRARVRR